jgi:hypothetical protein
MKKIIYKDYNGDIKKGMILDKGWDSYYVLVLSENGEKMIFVPARNVINTIEKESEKIKDWLQKKLNNTIQNGHLNMIAKIPVIEIQEKIRELERNNIVLIAGSNRTGTSLVAKILFENGFEIPNIDNDNNQYIVYESKIMRRIAECRKLGGKVIWENVKNLIKGKMILKHPKSSFMIEEWEKNFPDAKFIYVLREPRMAIWKQVQTWGHFFLPFWGKYWNEYNNGYRKMMGVKNLYIISYERLLKFPELEKKKLLDFVIDGGDRSGTA